MSDQTDLPLPYQPDSPEANFSYWAKMSEWHYEEAAAILVGINPIRLKLDEAKFRVSVGGPARDRCKGIRELALRAYLDIEGSERSDVTLQALCNRLSAERVVKADTSMMSRFFRKIGVTFKKRRSLRASRIVGT
jgi:hypothetical protein